MGKRLVVVSVIAGVLSTGCSGSPPLEEQAEELLQAWNRDKSIVGTEILGISGPEDRPFEVVLESASEAQLAEARKRWPKVVFTSSSGFLPPLTLPS
jgi:hypothetical protein